MTVLFLTLSAQQFGGTRQTTDSSNGKERQVSHRAGAVVTDSPAAQRIAAGQRPGSAPHSRWHGRAARPSTLPCPSSCDVPGFHSACETAPLSRGSLAPLENP